MEAVQDLYCKIFIDNDDPDEAIAKKVSLITSGDIDQWTVITDWSEIDIVQNDDFNEIKRREDPDGFLFYRYYIEMEPEENVLRQDYIMKVGRLLECLWKEGWEAVAACDFEDELPRKGGYRG